MSESMNASLTLSAPDLLVIAQALAVRPEFSQGPPDVLMLGDDRVAASADWRSLLRADGRAVHARWGDSMRTLFDYLPPEVVSARLPLERDAVAGMALLAPLPFELASFGTLHRDWLGTYTPAAFAAFHALPGWACAFRGAGHDHLVSRRWLEFGPWRLVKAADDLSFVQFHDLAADSATALQQARAGHERMGVGDTGGFLRDDHVFADDVKGLYVAAERKLVVTATGEVSQRAMRDACAARRQRRQDAAQPVERIAYLFIDEALARRHLHELWLRELECWALVDGQQRRLDDGYAPAPRPPAWVVRLAH